MTPLQQQMREAALRENSGTGGLLGPAVRGSDAAYSVVEPLLTEVYELLYEIWDTIDANPDDAKPNTPYGRLKAALGIDVVSTEHAPLHTNPRTP